MTSHFAQEKAQGRPSLGLKCVIAHALLYFFNVAGGALAVGARGAG
jgi:hypothetical protein